MTVSILACEAEGELSDFLDLPRLIYAEDTGYCPVPDEQVIAELRDPRFSGRQLILLARRNGELVARLVARWRPDLLDEAEKPYGLLGFFEAFDDQDAANALFAEARSWFSQQGTGAVIGPIDGDTWHRYRLNVGPWEHPPFLMEPYNPRYYERLWTEAGFKAHEEYYSKVVDDVRLLVPRLVPLYERVLARGYTLRRLDPQRFDQELEIIHRLSCQVFADNYLYVPINFHDFAALYRDASSLVDADLCWIAANSAGKPVGFVFALPDYFEAVRQSAGRSWAVAAVKFLLHKRDASRVNIQTLGVLPEARRAGVASALMHQVYSHSAAKGWTTANLCLIRRGNVSGRFDLKLGRILRSYRIYRLPK